MAKTAVPLRDMYQLTNPDPLRRHTVRSVAQAAGCSISTVQRLRSGKLDEVSEPIARSLARAVGMEFTQMFQRSGRVAWN